MILLDTDRCLQFLLHTHLIPEIFYSICTLCFIVIIFSDIIDVFLFIAICGVVGMAPTPPLGIVIKSGL